MANVTIPFEETGNALELSSFLAISANTVLSMSLAGANSAAAKYASAASGSTSFSGDMDELHLKTNVANAFVLSGVSFSAGGKRYVSKASGDLHVDLSPITGNGTKVGTLTSGQGEVVLNTWPAGMAPAVTDWRGVAGAPVNGAFTPFNTYLSTFRIATAPIRTGSFSVLGTMQDGTTFNYSADSDGTIDEPRVKGRINYTTGVVKLVGVTPSAPAGATPVDLSFLDIPGLTTAYIDLIRQETLRYNAVAFTYLPLDADLLGIDPVRLPSDGRVPIFRPGELAVVGHRATTAPATAVNGGVVNVGRTRLSRVRVLGNDGHVIETGYSENLEAGTVTWNDVTGYSQPVRVEHSIEDTGLQRDAQIDGTITFTRPLTHDYPIGSYVSSALRAGDMKARVSLVFDQATWNGTTFSDVPVGDPAPGTYNTVGYPITVTNDGAYTERWALRFKTTSTVEVFGEHVGNLGEFSINAVIQPINSVNNKPFFTIQPAGWGGGWVPGNLLRANTVGAMFGVWMVRTVQQGPASAADYSFLTVVRGDVDNPAT
ncbi:hypothetical protein [Variovorax paradoxus]|uniref:Uncharacterized protein n=1 Tax=Variovorax paradoxus TaxID=34073 RepID=A0A6I6HJA0_VARPD|nr:hypothetical protein [Variovorax paradoxus]QGW82929.1 hypothetical protein GOQ09_15695 [Variovorax paradoxus]